MEQIESNSVDLIITSPPYNAGKDYDIHDDNQTREKYEKFLYDTWVECFRVLKDSGRICINVANLGRKPYYHLSGIVSSQLERIGFMLWGEIIWIKKKEISSSSYNGNTAWGSYQMASYPVVRDSHEYIVLAAKTDYKLQHKGVSDITKEEFAWSTLGEWHIRPETNIKNHPVPFPTEIPHRLIKLYSYVGATVLDPFAGSGTTCYVAKKLNRNYIGYDISPYYCKVARKRCSQTFIRIKR